MPSDESTVETLHELGGALENASAVMFGESDELAARRPHPDAHLYDVEEGLRWAAREAERAVVEHYYER